MMILLLLFSSLLVRGRLLMQLTSSSSTFQSLDRLESQRLTTTDDGTEHRHRQIQSNNNNNNYHRMGVKRLLVVRVSNRAVEAPRETVEEIEAAVFGLTPNNNNHEDEDAAAAVSLAAQMYAVSHGALSYKPAAFVFAAAPTTTTIYNENDEALLSSINVSSFHPNNNNDTGVWIRSGVIDMEINVPTMMDTSGVYTHFYAVVRPAIMARLEGVLHHPHQRWDTIADHVLFCLPTGSLRNEAAAMGDVGGPFSYYHYESCTKLQVLMHEMGHNLNFLHGDVNGNEYADFSGYMGGNQAAPTWRDQLFVSKSSASSRGHPKKAFNGFNHWQSGWFQDRAVEVNPEFMGGSSLHRIASFVDYGNPAMTTTTTTTSKMHRTVVLIKVGPLYIQYNRAKGYNHDAPVPDTVTVTQAWTETANSNRVAALKQGAMYTAYNVSSSTSTKHIPLIIQVCTLQREPVGVMDFADVSFHLDDGTHQSACRPFTGGKSAGTGESVALTSIVIGALHVSDAVRTAASVLFLLCCLVVTIVCIDACCFFLCVSLCDRGRRHRFIGRDGDGTPESTQPQSKGTSDDATVINEDTDDSFA